MKALQFFSDEHLKMAKKYTPTQIAKFLDDYSKLRGASELRPAGRPTKLIRIRLPLENLAALKALSKTKQIPYQTFINQMIENALSDRTTQALQADSNHRRE